jgi:hypothetical protein
MTSSSLSQSSRSCSSGCPQTPLLQAISSLADLAAQLSRQLSSSGPVTHAPAPAQPWQEPLPTAERRSSTQAAALWDELSVVELRSLLRSYPIDRSSLPAPIELLRRGELMEALSQIQALGA